MTLITFLVSAIKFGMVLLLGSTGETITEKSGHLNLGLPGVMCMGAACGCYAEYAYLTDNTETYNPALAVLLPILVCAANSHILTRC